MQGWRNASRRRRSGLIGGASRRRNRPAGKLMTGPDESFAEHPERRIRKPEGYSESISDAPRTRPSEAWGEFDEPAEFRPLRPREDEDASHLRLLSIFHFVAA